MRALFAGFCAVLALAGCNQQVHSNSDEVNSSQDTTSIIGGNAVTERNSEAARAVVLVAAIDKDGRPMNFCTATLIGKNTVLTAAHCWDPKSHPTMTGFNVVFTNFYRPQLPGLEKRKGLSFYRSPFLQ